VGRPRRATHLKILAGERESRINRGEPIPSEGEVSPPAQLGDAAQQVWDRLAPDLIDKGCLTGWDADLFAVFCDAVATYHQCRAVIGSNYTTKGAVKDTTVKAPLWRIMLDCVDTMARIGGKFGLTPSDRAGLDLSEVEPRPVYGPERLLS